MKLKNVLMVVKDIDRSKAFYKELFGLDIVTDFGEKVILTEGLVLHERQLWETLIEKETSFGSHEGELYFQESDMDSFLERLGQSNQQIEYLNPVTENVCGQRVVRIYDPDRHVIEICESLDAVTRRGLNADRCVE